METFSKYLAVAIGGAFGAVLRYGLNQSFLANYLAPFPFHTFFINITGSFAIGFLLTFFAEKFEINETITLALTVGFLGAYTTFSTFEFETLQLVREKNLFMAIFYVSLSFACGLIAVFGGVILAKKF